MHGKRAASGSAAANNGLALGMDGIIPQIEQRGNVANERLHDIEDLSKIAKRIKQQGGSCRTFTFFADHDQIVKCRQMLAGVNAAYASGTNYGVFENKENMVKLGFEGVFIDGVTFYFTPLAFLDDPTLFGATNFESTGIAGLIIPTGETHVCREQIKKQLLI